VAFAGHMDWKNATEYSFLGITPRGSLQDQCNAWNELMGRFDVEVNGNEILIHLGSIMSREAQFVVMLDMFNEGKSYAFLVSRLSTGGHVKYIGDSITSFHHRFTWQDPTASDSPVTMVKIMRRKMGIQWSPTKVSIALLNNFIQYPIITIVRASLDPTDSHECAKNGVVVYAP